MSCYESINTKAHCNSNKSYKALIFYMLGASMLEHMLCYRYQKDLSIAFM